jgi:hypothetical protein
MAIVPPPRKDYHYDLKKAKEETKRWRESQKIKAYFVDVEELLDVIKEGNMDAMRIYFGLEEDGTEKMFLVAAERIYNDKGETTEVKDLIDEDTYDADVLRDGDGHFVYDFSNPCPATCDEKSPLMN